VSIVLATPPSGHVGGFYDAIGRLWPAAVRLYVGNVPKKPSYPYAVLWGDLGEETTEALDDVPTEMRIRFRVTYVGLSLDQVAWAASRIRPALNRAQPYVPGWLTGKLRQAPLMDVQTDFSVTLENGAHPMYAVDEFALSADKSETLPV
jgi:hypothetical protein